MLNTPLGRFLFYFLLAASLWTPGLVAASAWLGGSLFEGLTRNGLRLVIALILLWVLFAALRLFVLPLFRAEGRRRWVGRFRRWRRWEFWPPWAFYPPLVLYVLYLGVRHRSLTLFTACNPAIPAGGFVGESKTEILSRLAGADAALPRWAAVPVAEPAERLARVERFQAEHGLGYPLVLKPDAGQRGTGVAVVRKRSEVEEYFAKVRLPAIVQEYVGGREFGVFWYRFPAEEHGKVFAITEKLLPAVTGDGLHTLRELILRDERAVAIADVYFAQQASLLDAVPAAGERIPIVEIAAHSRGAVFLDATERATPALAAALDRIADVCSGFDFGRYDLRVAGYEELMAGGPFKILELNGVTSEATNIYDSGCGLLQAYRILMRQWRIAFAIGEQRRARGHAPVGVRALCRATIAYRRASRLLVRFPVPRSVPGA
jgi:hypothetical protein